MKYTKGKWIVSESGNLNFNLCIVAEDGGSVCHITNWSEEESNAKLISKTPEMLEALKWFVNSINNGTLIVFTDDDQHKSVRDDNQYKINKIESLVKELE